MKSFQWSNIITIYNLQASKKNQFFYFSGDVWKTAVFKSFRSFQKKIFSSNAIRVVSKVPSILKTCASSVKIAGRGSVVESELAKQQENYL